MARIQANIRRAGRTEHEAPDAGACRGFTLVGGNRVVRADGQERVLSPIEMQILTYLMRNPGKYITAEELYKNVWGKDSFGDSRTVVVHIHNLRKKVDPGEEPLYIKNVWGKGYLFDPEGTPDA